MDAVSRCSDCTPTPEERAEQTERMVDLGGRIIVDLFEPDHQPREHLRIFHGIDLAASAPFAVLTRIHTADHFSYGLGRHAMPIPHWHSAGRTMKHND